MLRANHIHWLFNSYEMKDEEITERLAAMLSVDMSTKEGRAMYIKATAHIHFIRDGNLTLEGQLEVKRFIENKYNCRILGMVSDYLGLIPVSDPNKPGYIIGHETAALNRLTKIAKDITAKEGFLHIFLSQVPKEAGGNGRIVLYPSDAKGSKQIEAMSDLVTTMWRPYKQITTHIDDAFTIWPCKFRHGPDLPYLNYKWSGKNLLIGDKYKEPINQTERPFR